MGQVAGTGGYSASGSVGVAIVGSDVHLSFQDFATSAEGVALVAVLTINGNLAKRHLDLGDVPPGQGNFSLSAPPGTDMSLFNTVVVRLAEADTPVATASVP